MKTIKWDIHESEAEVIKENEYYLLTKPAVGGSLFRPDSIGYRIWKAKDEEFVADFHDNARIAELVFDYLTERENKAIDALTSLCMTVPTDKFQEVNEKIISDIKTKEG